MNGLAKGLAIIEAFTFERSRLSVSEAAVLSATSPAAARRCLLTLHDLGYVSYDGKYFRPTPRLTRLGASYTDTAPLPALAQPHLIAARDELDEPISLAVLEGEFSAIIARAEASRMVSASIRLGSRLPLYTSSTGRVLLASLPQDRVDDYLEKMAPVPTTNKTILDVEELRSRVLHAREDGFAFTDEEIELGVRTMAVAVRDSAGTTHAAIGLSALSARVTIDEMRTRFLPTLQRVAKELGKML